MNRTAPIVARRRLAYALNATSKECLIDCVATLAIRRLHACGIKAPSDEEIAGQLQALITDVQRARGERPVELVSKMVLLDECDERYMTGPKSK